jgi:8-amino-7-oxononanoate synthase
VKTNERLLASLDQLKLKNQLRQLKLKEDLVDFSSNDYLGLNRNEELISLIQSIEHYRFGSGGSRLLSGNALEAVVFEKKLTQVHHKEAALLFNSGYNANLAFFSTIPNKDSIIIYDEKVHASIKDGMRLSFASKMSFKHNNLKILSKRLTQNIGKECFVVVESVYSMDGDEASLQEIALICEAFGANLIVDEAHTTGSVGEKGSGLVSYLGLDHLVFAKIHTFGKAIGAHGAAVLSNEVVKQYLINHARPFIFTTALPAHDVQVLSAIYTFIENNWKELQNELNIRLKWFKDSIKVDIPPSNSPIQVVLVPGNEAVKSMSAKLEKNGLDVRPVMSPTVAKGEERLRICLHAYNTKEEIELLTSIINTNL